MSDDDIYGQDTPYITKLRESDMTQAMSKMAWSPNL